MSFWHHNHKIVYYQIFVWMCLKVASIYSAVMRIRVIHVCQILTFLHLLSTQFLSKRLHFVTYSSFFCFNLTAICFTVAAKYECSSYSPWSRALPSSNSLRMYLLRLASLTISDVLCVCV